MMHPMTMTKRKAKSILQDIVCCKIMMLEYSIWRS